MQNILGWLGPFGLFGCFLGIMVVMFALSVAAASKRRKALQALAESLGFTYQASADPSILRLLPPFQLFSAGRAQRVDNLLEGSTESTQVQIFDWQYTTGGGKNTVRHKTTVVIIHAQDLDLTSFYCRPENLLDWVGLTFDGKDIDFDDRPLFSKKFHLHGNLEKRVRKLFDVEVCEFFEGHLGMYAEGSRQWLVYYKNDAQVRVDEIRQRFQDAFQLYLLLKVRAADSDESGSAAAVSDEARD